MIQKYFLCLKNRIKCIDCKKRFEDQKSLKAHKRIWHENLNVVENDVLLGRSKQQDEKVKAKEQKAIDEDRKYNETVERTKFELEKKRGEERRRKD